MDKKDFYKDMWNPKLELILVELVINLLIKAYVGTQMVLKILWLLVAQVVLERE